MPQWIINTLLILGALFINGLINTIDINLAGAFTILGIGGSSIWVYYDAKKIKFDTYKNPRIFMNSNTLSALVMIFWIIFFPWYLSQRRKILSGKIPLNIPTT